MSVSFEELADAGLTPEQLQGPDTVSNKRWLSLLTLIAAAGACGGWFYWIKERPPEINETAERLLVSEEVAEATGALPHVLDDKTEFGESITYLKEGIREPEIREAEMPLLGSEVAAESDQLEAEQPEPSMSEEAISEVENAEIVVEVPVVEVSAPVVETAPAEEVVIVTPSVVEMDLVTLRDWGGVVLVPDNVRLSRAFSSAVRLVRIEAHPIDGDRLRVWVRIQNITDKDLKIRVGCSFRSINEKSAGAGFEVVEIPSGYALDTHFVSSEDMVKAYTLLVKRLN